MGGTRSGMGEAFPQWYVRTSRRWVGGWVGGCSPRFRGFCGLGAAAAAQAKYPACVSHIHVRRNRFLTSGLTLGRTTDPPPPLSPVCHRLALSLRLRVCVKVEVLCCPPRSSFSWALVCLLWAVLVLLLGLVTHCCLCLWRCTSACCCAALLCGSANNGDSHTIAAFERYGASKKPKTKRQGLPEAAARVNDPTSLLHQPEDMRAQKAPVQEAIPLPCHYINCTK